jgi:very-short-patch-repair endonuclease
MVEGSPHERDRPGVQSGTTPSQKSVASRNFALAAIAGSKVRIRKQHPIGPYVLDFYCPSAKLAIEVDGFAHDTGDRPRRDEIRTEWLESQGLKIMRIPAKDVLADPDSVADSLLRLCASEGKPLHHSALPSGPPPHACGAGRS